MMDKNNDNNDKQLRDSLVVLFLSILKYKDDKEFKKLLIMYKEHREELKDYVGKIYLKHIRNNELNMTYKDINREIKKLESKLKVMGNDLKKQEDIILGYLLYKVYEDSYNKGTDIISKYKSVVEVTDSNLKDKTIKDTINSKIDGKNNIQRNKTNKEKFVNKVKNDIKKDLMGKKSIEVINNHIDKDFNSSINVSGRLLDNEIGRVFTGALMQSYKDNNIKRVEWVSELENNTCGECMGLDGEIFNIEEALIPVMDTHVSCKCVLIPVID